MAVCEDHPAKVFDGGEIGVDAEGDGEGPLAKLFGEDPPEKGVLVEAMLVKSLKMVAKSVMPEPMPMWAPTPPAEGWRSRVKMHLS